MYQSKQTLPKTCYRAVLKRYYTREIGVYESYDIVMTKGSNIIYELNDLSNDLHWVTKFVNLLNEEDVSHLHVKDLAMDFLP